MQDAKWVTRDEAVQKAIEFLRIQPWADDCDEKSARVIESNECINILFKFKLPQKPAETMISVEKIGGHVEWIKLG